jgi:hypothetical protein
MKNMLAENLLRFGVKNLNEKDKQKLMEQTDLWDAINGGASGKGLKVKIIDFPANVPLTSPSLGALKFDEFGGSFAKKPVYVGAHIQMQYNQLADMKQVNSAGAALSAQFGFSLDFYLSTAPDTANFSNSKASRFFEIKGARLRNGTFQIITQPVFTADFAKTGFLSEKGSRLPMPNSLASNELFANLNGWLGKLPATINTTLSDWGYPVIPNQLIPKSAQLI